MLAISWKALASVFAAAFAGILVIACWPRLEPSALNAKASVEQPVFVNPPVVVSSLRPAATTAQPFAKDEYLHPRPSAAGNGYDPTSSGGSNYGPLNTDFAKRVAGDADALRKSTGHPQIPDDAITTSGSGLDPDISPEYALLQADRVAKARGVSADQVRGVISAHVEGAFLGFIGQAHINVLKANLDLDAKAPKRSA